LARISSAVSNARIDHCQFRACLKARLYRRPAAARGQHLRCAENSRFAAAGRRRLSRACMLIRSSVNGDALRTLEERESGISKPRLSHRTPAEIEPDSRHSARSNRILNAATSP
jgi:hypothetical protein